MWANLRQPNWSRLCCSWIFRFFGTDVYSCAVPDVFGTVLKVRYIGIPRASLQSLASFSVFPGGLVSFFYWYFSYIYRVSELMEILAQYKREGGPSASRPNSPPTCILVEKFPLEGTNVLLGRLNLRSWCLDYVDHGFFGPEKFPLHDIHQFYTV
jgi:hypothetical protein